MLFYLLHICFSVVYRCVSWGFGLNGLVWSQNSNVKTGPKLLSCLWSGRFYKLKIIGRVASLGGTHNFVILELPTFAWGTARFARNSRARQFCLSAVSALPSFISTSGSTGSQNHQHPQQPTLVAEDKRKGQKKKNPHLRWHFKIQMPSRAYWSALNR